MISQTPWRRGIGNQCHTIFDGQGSIVASQAGTSDGTLIAAAPDLQYALKAVLDYVNYDQDHHKQREVPKPILQMANDALSKSR